VNYLVTGACGFIGSRTAEGLLSDGHRVTGIDNLNDAYDVRLKLWRRSQLVKHPDYRDCAVDICDLPSLRRIFAEHGPFDAVVNLAARAGVRQSLLNPWVYLDTNCGGTINLLELCREHRIPKFVLASTSSLYGAHNALPYSEDANTDRPLSPYAASKKAAEAMCHSYRHLYGLDITVLRYFTVYGPAGRPDMSAFRFVQWISEGLPVTIFGDGSQSRDFTYVEDIAAGTIAALRTAGSTTLNLGSDAPAPLMELVHIVERLTGKRANLVFKPAHPADVPATWADITRAREKLGWFPKTSLEEGMAHLVDWYNSNRGWAKDVKTD
jgi:nucleoside-diphosphate-sugar epimerase